MQENSKRLFNNEIHTYTHEPKTKGNAKRDAASANTLYWKGSYPTCTIKEKQIKYDDEEEE